MYLANIQSRLLLYALCCNLLLMPKVVLASKNPSDILSLVNPFIGTTNGGNVFPGMVYP